MESFGQYLIRQREFRRIDRDEIATATRVPLHTITALEEDRVDDLPARAFVKGHIHAYAKYIGLDPNDAVLRFEEFLTANGGTEPDPAAPRNAPDMPHPSRHAQHPTQRSTPSWVRMGLLLITAALAVAAALVILW